MVTAKLATDPTVPVLFTYGSYNSPTSPYGGSDLYVQKWATNGTRLWAFAAGTAGEDQATGLAVDVSTGESYIVGCINQPAFLPALCPTKTDSGVVWTPFIVKLNAAGVAIKCAYLDVAFSTYNMYPTDVVYQPNAGGTGVATLFVGGYTSQTNTGAGQPVMWRVNPTDLSKVWTKPFSSTTNGAGYYRLALSPVENNYVWACGLERGQANQVGSADFFFQKLAYSDGTPAWSTYYGSSGWDESPVPAPA